MPLFGVKCFSLFFGIIFIGSASAAQILAYFPFPLKSHHKIFQPIIAELANRGHHITYVAPFAMDETPFNVTHVSTERLIDRNVMGEVGFFKYKLPSVWRQMLLLKKVSEIIFDETFKFAEVQKLVRSNETFDVVIHGLFCQEHAAAFQHKFKALGISIVTFGDNSWVNELAGAPDMPSYMMNFFSQLSQDMNFFERVQAHYTLMLSTLMSYYSLYKMQDKVDQVFQFEEKKPLVDLISDQALILAHSHHAVGYPFPAPPHLKQIGGIAIPPAQQLEKDLEEFIRESPHGVIYFSLGSTTQMFKIFSEKVRDDFSNAFRKLKQRVLWKWEGEAWPGMPSNVKISPWLPQSDVLAHENVKVFITQGGLLSLFETVFHRVPVIVVPLFGDQGKNAKFITASQIGVKLDYSSITEESITRALNQTIDNRKFELELARRSKLLKDSPRKPVDEAVYWIEYVIEHGKALQPKGTRLPFYQLHSLDVLAFLVIVLFVISNVLLKSLRLGASFVKQVAAGIDFNVNHKSKLH